MNETLVIQVIIGRNFNLRTMDLHSSIDREVLSLYQELLIKSQLMLVLSLCQD